MCAVPENIHTYSKEGNWKFQGGGVSQKAKFLKESMNQNWNFQKGDGGGEGFKTKNPLWNRYGYFPEQHTPQKQFPMKLCGVVMNS